MKLDKFAIILMLTLFIGGAAFYFSDQQKEKLGDNEAGVVFLTTLTNKVNKIAQVIITEKSSETHLVLKENRWIVQEKSGYDANFSNIKKLLLGLAELKTIESKTANPENYGRLGVQDVGQPGEVESKQIQLLDKADNVLYTLIVGKVKPSRVPGAKSSLYVRKKGDTKSWLVAGAVDIPRTQIEWLNTKVIDLKSVRIQSVEIRQPDKSHLLISKKDKADANFSVENLPSEAKLKSESVANPIASALQNLNFEEVLSRGTFKAEEAQITTAEFKTFNGLSLTAKLIEKDQKHYMWFDAKSDGSNEEAAKESSELNSSFALWVYQIPKQKADAIVKKLDDLLEVDKE